MFVFGGFLAAFTEVGAILVFAGLAMLVSGILLCTPLRTVFAFGSGGLVFVALTAHMVLELS